MKDVFVYWIEVPEKFEVDSLVNYFLDEIEKERYYSYLNPKKAEEFLLGRVLLKWALSKHTRESIHGISLQADKYGKLAQKDRITPFFNLTHSENMIACILSENGKVGVDLEFIPYESLEVMDLVFNNREKAFVLAERSINKRKEAFYLVWTRKEAFMKAIGKGFSLNPKAIDIPTNYESSRKGGFSYFSFKFHEDYLLSLAYEGNLDKEHLHIEKVFLKQLEKILN
ncbi:4'-phosphopantetheinyl transferase family protein [Priestia aryabhattai]|uniref:4'-phosphopantetheinyl transferase family protein n=1 Tax=Priestia aryabhattai TaxID=412384 RepID=UPI00237FF3CE|nr:4'-phosphopantetheinyl transferase superfamily protein [Priestia aryabhattai]WDW10029.1 4'-phosphopantetheinyl transferase superfamily protein [Priestia aryabhattai]